MKKDSNSNSSVRLCAFLGRESAFGKREGMVETERNHVDFKPFVPLVIMNIVIKNYKATKCYKISIHW